MTFLDPLPAPRSPGSGTHVAATRHRPNDVDLPALLTDLLTARAAVAQDLSPSRNRQPTAVRAELLACLEAYAAALTARRLPIPPRLRDELRLHRALYPPANGSPGRRS